MEKSNSVTKTKLKQLANPVPPPPLPDKPEGGLVAKSPPGPVKSSTLQSRGSEETALPRRDPVVVRVLVLSSLQVVCGLLMVLMGVLSILHDAAMSGYAAGFWAGGAAVATGLAGVSAGLRGYHHPPAPLGATATTVYLALCLVAVATTTLALVLTSTGLLRDLHRPVVQLEDMDGVVSQWGCLLSSLGLLLVTALLLVSLVMAALRVYRQVCPCSRRPQHRLLESHSPASSQCAAPAPAPGKVHSWLGSHPHTPLPPPVLYPAQQPPPLVVYPPPLLVEGGGLYSPVGLGFHPHLPPLQQHPYSQRRRSPHPHSHSHSNRGRNSVTPDSTKRSRRSEKPREKEPKEKEITDEQLERTYTGLDREIAEEFISIAMTNPDSDRTK